MVPCSSYPELARLTRTASEVNLAKQAHVTQRIRRAANRFRDPRIAILGLSYKPNVDDLRESPAMSVVQDLISDDVGEVYLVEPNIRPSRRLSPAEEGCIGHL